MDDVVNGIKSDLHQRREIVSIRFSPSWTPEHSGLSVPMVEVALNREKNLFRMANHNDGTLISTSPDVLHKAQTKSLLLSFLGNELEGRGQHMWYVVFMSGPPCRRTEGHDPAGRADKTSFSGLCDKRGKGMSQLRAEIFIIKIMDAQSPSSLCACAHVRPPRSCFA